jgi:hypothetical protein
MTTNADTTLAGTPADRDAAARPFRRMTWAYLFFLPIVNTYADAAGWLFLLLLSLSLPAGPLAAGWRPRGLVIAGLAVSCARVALFAAGVIQADLRDAALLSISLLLAAALLREVCRPLIRLSAEAGDRVLPAQARVRSLAYVVYAVLPFSLAGVAPFMPTAAKLAVTACYLVVGTALTTLVIALFANAANLCRAAAVAPHKTPPD